LETRLIEAASTKNCPDKGDIMTDLDIKLRLETKSDYDTVERVTYRAFLGVPHASGDEAWLARKLRSCAAFVSELDYVAELDGAVIGNIMYTRSKVVGDAGEWETLTFGPVSVLPQYQRQGTGGALINKTLTLAREMDFRGVLIFGHEDYYPRFGFTDASQYGIATADGENFPAFMALPLYEGALNGVHGRLVCDDVYFTLDKAESEALNAKLAEPMNTPI
jgi:predicted N-acetyltransferase YhbS